jgi:hypothetical protein
MNRHEYEEYRGTVANPGKISIRDLDDGDYTLAYGYTVDRYTWHAYVADDEIHVIVYSNGVRGLSFLVAHGNYGSEALPEVLRPNRRVYPDTVNKTFAYLMRDAGCELPFISYFDFDSHDVARRAGRTPWVGKTHFDF